MHNAGGYMVYLNNDNKFPTSKCQMKALPPELRPDERLMYQGAESLSDAELLAVILRTGNMGQNVVRLAESILLSAGDDGLIGLCRLSIGQLMNHRGVGQVKAIQIKAVAELAKRIAKKTAKKRLSFNNPDTVADYYMEDMRHRNTECLMMLSLNGKGGLLGETILSTGTVNSSIASPREIFIQALQQNAVSIILIHNHPSGDPSPSRQDVYMTEKIKNVGELLGISLVDHIIIGDNIYVSLKEKNLL